MKKLDINFIKDSFESEGYVLLTDEYVAAHQKLNYICKESHKHKISWNKWKSGKRCAYCAGNIKLTTDYVKNTFLKENYILISFEYINNYSHLLCTCPNGHEHITTWINWIQGHRCAECAGLKKPTIEFIKNEFLSEGYLLLTEEYINAHQKLMYRCPKGHEHGVSWNGWSSKHLRCPYCSNRVKHTIDFISKSFRNNGYTLVSNEYKNAHSNLEYICDVGHNGNMTWHSWSMGRRCLECSGKKKKTIDDVSNSFESYGYKLLTEEYVDSHQVLDCICTNNHLYKVPWKNWNNKGYRCPRCSNTGTSVQELLILKFIEDTYKGEVVSRSRLIISPKELDIVIPNKKIAIEYCGIYWHLELMGKDRNYHLKKLNLCNDAGYRLITIFEDELLYNKDLVFSRLKNLFNHESLQVVYARKCVIKEIDAPTARIFCNENHLQGYTGSNIKLGAFYKDDLVSVMTFSKPSIAKGCKNSETGVWELSRFCSLKNHRVIGIASKLLKHFERNYEWKEIFSYADRRWSDGNLYRKIGFDFAGETKPNYWYFKKSDTHRIHRFALRKTKKDPKDQTEWQIRQSQGYNRIWDCGNLKYVNKLN